MAGGAGGGFGAYGKIPGLGDFFRLGLPQSFVAPWDGWLQATLGAARAALGPRWQELYLTAPVWHFALAPGLAGPEGWLGVLMPSVDRVGRMFPLTLAAPCRGEAAALHAGWDGGPAAEALARAMLEDGAGREDLVAGLAALPAPPGHARPELRQTPGLRVLQAPGLVSGWGALGAGRMAQGLARPSLWSATLADGARHLAVEGLPGPGAAAALFDPGDALWPAGAAAEPVR